MLTRHKRVYPARPFPWVAVGKGSGYARLGVVVLDVFSLVDTGKIAMFLLHLCDDVIVMTSLFKFRYIYHGDRKGCFSCCITPE